LEDLKKMIVLMERIVSLAFPDDDKIWIRLAAVTKSDIALKKRYRKRSQPPCQFGANKMSQASEANLPVQENCTDSLQACQERSLHFKP